MSARVSIFNRIVWFVTVGISVFTGDYIAFHPGLKHDIWHWSTLGLAIVAIAAIAAVAWAFTFKAGESPSWHRTKVVVAMLTVIVFGVWGSKIFSGHLFLLAGAVVVLGILHVLTFRFKNTTAHAARGSVRNRLANLLAGTPSSSTSTL